jgi:hypothetical protein
MIHIECPYCDQALPLERGESELECAECGIRLELAPESPVREQLSLAA